MLYPLVGFLINIESIFGLANIRAFIPIEVLIQAHLKEIFAANFYSNSSTTPLLQAIDVTVHKQRILASSTTTRNHNFSDDPTVEIIDGKSSEALFKCHQQIQD